MNKNKMKSNINYIVQEIRTFVQENRTDKKFKDKGNKKEVKFKYL